MRHRGQSSFHRRGRFQTSDHGGHWASVFPGTSRRPERRCQIRPLVPPRSGERQRRRRGGNGAAFRAWTRRRQEPWSGHLLVSKGSSPRIIRNRRKSGASALNRNGSRERLPGSAQVAENPAGKGKSLASLFDPISRDEFYYARYSFGGVCRLQSGIVPRRAPEVRGDHARGPA